MAVTVLRESTYQHLLAKARPTPVVSESQQGESAAARFLQAARERSEAKERALAERRQAEEDARVLLDEVERAFREERRLHLLEAANKVLWDEGDSVKQLHSTLLLNDVLAERRGQLAEAAAAKAEAKAEAEADHRKLLEAVKVAEEQEKVRAAAGKRQRLAQQAAQQVQLDELRQSILQDRATKRQEGAALSAKAAEELAAFNQKEAEVKAREQLAVAETRRANDVLQGFKKQKAQWEVEADASTRAHAERKLAEAAALKLAQAEAQRVKDKAKRKLVAALDQQLRQAREEENARLAALLVSSEEKLDSELAEKARLQKADHKALLRSHEQQLREKAERAIAQAAQEREQRRAVEERKQELEVQEAVSARARLADDKEHSEYLRRQAAEKEGLRARARVAETTEDGARRWHREDQQQRFDAYANVCLEEWQRQGKPTAATQRFLKQHKKVVAGKTVL